MWTYVGTIVALCLGYHMINQMATQVSAAQLTTTSTSPLSPFLHYLFYVSMLHVGVLGMAQYASILGPLPFSPRASHTPPFPVCRTSRLTRQPYPFWFSPPVPPYAPGLLICTADSRCRLVVCLDARLYVYVCP